jgi:hypothetical protein
MLMTNPPKPEIVISQRGGENFFVFIVMSVPRISPGRITYIEILKSCKSQYP